MVKLLAQNNQARLLSPVYKVEAGLVLTGPLVSSLRARNVSLSSAHLRFFGPEPFLVGLKIARPKDSASASSVDPEPLKVLLKKGEIEKVRSLLSQKGLVCLPSQVYTTRRFIKVELRVGRILRKWEKREKEKKEEWHREVQAGQF